MLVGQDKGKLSAPGTKQTDLSDQNRIQSFPRSECQGKGANQVRSIKDGWEGDESAREKEILLKRLFGGGMKGHKSEGTVQTYSIGREMNTGVPHGERRWQRMM